MGRRDVQAMDGYGEGRAGDRSWAGGKSTWVLSRRTMLGGLEPRAKRIQGHHKAKHSEALGTIKLNLSWLMSFYIRSFHLLSTGT